MKISTSVKIGLATGMIGAIAVLLLITFTILRSTVLTSVIGFVFLPFWFLAAFICFFLWGYSIGYIKSWISGVPRILSGKNILVFVFNLFFSISVLFWSVEGLLVTSAVSKIQKVTRYEELQDIFNTSYFKSNKFVLGALAQNQAASTELLDQIAKLDDPSLHVAMGSIFPVLGDNQKGLAVMRLVVRNKNVSLDTIEYIGNISQIDYVLGDVAGNEKTSIATLRKLGLKNKYLIDWGLAQNQNTPTDLFNTLLEREKNFTQRTTLEMLLQNPSASPEILSRANELLKQY
jgi:hypothetical protein